MKILIHQFGRHTKPGKHLDAKMTKVGMSSEEGADYDEEGGVHGRHDDDGADSVGPWSILHTPPQAQPSAHRRPHQEHGARPRNSKDGTHQCHFGVPFGCIPWWHYFGL